MASETIYVALLDEDADVWRPVRAESLGDNVFRIDPQAKVPDDELWQFGPGEMVRCRTRRFGSGCGLEAFETAI